MQSKPRRARRWPKRLAKVVLALLLAFGLGCALRLPVCMPFDWFWNLGAPLNAPELRPADDGRTRVVFLQHGLWRTRYSLDRLERTLRHNGYEVINSGYASTQDSIEGHAALLREVVERRVAAGGVDEIAFVGHSMGGLVIQEYLRGEGAREPFACVYLATPHRGAVLADARRHWFLFRWVMGDRAAQQLATTAEIHRRAIPLPERSGTVVGDIGEGSRSIPGRDDGTVGVAEATFAGARDVIVVPHGHTSIVVRDAVFRQVLHFLQQGAFAQP